MTVQVWTPKLGDKVKLTVRKTWGPAQGLPWSIMLTEVTKVTQAGYVSVRGRYDTKFKRGERTGRYFAHVPKSHVFSDFSYEIEPVSPDEIVRLPTDNAGGRAYAATRRRDLQAQQQQKEPT